MMMTQDLYITPLSLEKLSHDELLSSRALSLLLVQFLFSRYDEYLYNIEVKYLPRFLPIKNKEIENNDNNRHTLICLRSEFPVTRVSSEGSKDKNSSM